MCLHANAGIWNGMHICIHKIVSTIWMGFSIVSKMHLIGMFNMFLNIDIKKMRFDYHTYLVCSCMTRHTKDYARFTWRRRRCYDHVIG